MRINQNFPGGANQFAQRCLLTNNARVLRCIGGGSNAFGQVHQVGRTTNIIKNTVILQSLHQRNDFHGRCCVVQRHHVLEDRAVSSLGKVIGLADNSNHISNHLWIDDHCPQQTHLRLRRGRRQC